MNARERAAEFESRRHHFNRSDEHLPNHFDNEDVTSENASVLCELDLHSSIDTATNKKCSENYSHDYKLANKPDTALMSHLKQVKPTGDASEFTSTSDDSSYPLNLSLTGKVSDTAPRVPESHDSPTSRDSLVPDDDDEGRRSCSSRTQLPFGSRTDETATTCRQKLIVRQKIYDIVHIGYGLWLLDDSD